MPFMIVPTFETMLASTRARLLPPRMTGPSSPSSTAGGPLDHQVPVRTRSGREVTSALPELAPLEEALSGRSVLLEGERSATAEPAIARRCPEGACCFAHAGVSVRPATQFRYPAFNRWPRGRFAP